MRVIHALPLSIAFLVEAASAACPVTIDNSKLEARLDRAMAQLADLNVEGFRETSDGIQGMLPCLAEVVPPSLAARVHEVQALRAFGERSDDAAKAFAAVRLLDPNHALPTELFTPDNPIWQDYRAIALDSIGAEPLAPAREGALAFDGRVRPERPVGVPTLHQQLDADGSVVLTAYIGSEQRLPPYPGHRRLDLHAIRVPLTAAAAAGAVASAGTYLAAAHGQQRYLDAADPVAYQDLEPLRRTTNGLVITSGVLGLAAAGAGVAAAFAW